MAKTAVSELQQQIEEVRREAFATGYAVAMQAIRELASRPLAGTATPSRTRRGRAKPGAQSAATTPSRRRRARPSDVAARARRPAARRPQRGMNAQSIQEVLRAAAPRALRQAEIRKALQERDRGVIHLIAVRARPVGSASVCRAVGEQQDLAPTAAAQPAPSGFNLALAAGAGVATL